MRGNTHSPVSLVLLGRGNTQDCDGLLLLRRGNTQDCHGLLLRRRNKGLPWPQPCSPGGKTLMGLPRPQTTQHREMGLLGHPRAPQTPFSNPRAPQHPQSSSVAPVDAQARGSRVGHGRTNGDSALLPPGPSAPSLLTRIWDTRLQEKEPRNGLLSPSPSSAQD